MLSLIVTFLTTLLPVAIDRPAPVFTLRYEIGQSKELVLGGKQSSITIFCTVVPEGGGGTVMPVTITVSGKGSELVLKQILAQLADKPVGPKP